MAAPSSPVVVRFLGTRGSIPTPGPGTVRYGGNTSCVAVTVGDRRLVLDAGTGIRALGTEWAETGNPVRATVLLSHFHWDHIQGFPFFQPLHDPASRLEVVAPADRDEYVERRLGRQMEAVYFPVPIHGIRADCRFTACREGPLEIQGIPVRAFPVRHPSRTVGYRIDTPAGSICYLPDNELIGGRYDVPSDWRTRLENFVGGAAVLVHDTMFTDDEYESYAGWGHSTPGQTLELARAAGVAHVVGFHHSPERDDDALDALGDAVRTTAAGWGGRFDFAAEGDEIRLPAQAPTS